jgi:perosamine synthetase
MAEPAGAGAGSRTDAVRLGRTVPPAAAPLGCADLRHGLTGALRSARTIRALEDEIRDVFGVRHVFTVSSGSAALAIALMALRTTSPRREVVLPAFTCYSVPAAVIAAGLRPVLCDIDPGTFDFDHAQLARTVGDATLCVIAHHLFGAPAAIDRIRALCSSHGVAIVEDAAQAMGHAQGGRWLGTLGDVGIFSLGRGKNITCGSGGIIVTNSDAIAAAIAGIHGRLPAASHLRQFLHLLQVAAMMLFIRPSLYWIPAAMPWLGLGRTEFPHRIPLRPLSGAHAGLLRHWRTRLVASNRARAATAAYFCAQLSGLPVPADTHPYLRLPLVTTTPGARDRLVAKSRQRGLGLAVGYPTPVNGIREIQSTFEGQHFPAAQAVSERLVTVPTHHWLSDADKKAIADLCREAVAA